MISVKVKGEKKQLAPEEVSSMVLTKMKEIAEAYLGKEVRPLGCLAKKNYAETFTVTHTVARLHARLRLNCGDPQATRCSFSLINDFF